MSNPEDKNINSEIARTANDKKKLARNIIFNTFYQILTIITPLVTAPYLSRILDNDGVGIYSYTNSLVAYFTMFAALGTASYGNRTIALCRDSKKEYSKSFWEIELITVFTTTAMLAGWVLLASLYIEYRVYLFVLSLTLIATLFDISWFYSGMERYEFSIAINSFFKLISIVLILTLVKSKSDLWIYLLIHGGSLLLGNMSMWIFLPKFLCKAKPEFGCLKTHLKNTLVYFLPTIATSIYTVLDKTLIGVLIQGEISVEENGVEIVKKLADVENGYYEQANKILSLIKGVAFLSINGVMESRVSYLFGRGDHEGIKRIQNLTLSITSFLSIGATFGLIGIAKTFVPLFFGDQYDKTVTLIYILAPIICVICLSNVLGAIYYTPFGKRRQSTGYLLIGSITNLILNVPLILLFKSIGAAIASLIAESIIAILYFMFSRKEVFSLKGLFLILWKKLLAGAAMLIVILTLDRCALSGINAYLSLAIQILSGAGIYVLLLLALRDDSFKELFEFIKSKKRR